MRLLEPKDVWESFLLEPRSTYSLDWTWEHSLGQNRWWEQLGSLGQWFYHQCSNPWIRQGSFFGCQSYEQPGWWHGGYKWFGRVILPALGLCYDKGSSGRSVRLWQRSSGHSCTRFNCLWSQVLVTLGTPTINWIINMIKESEIDELSATLNGLRISNLLACHQAELSIRSEAAAATQTSGCDQFEWGCQNNKDWKK